MADRRKKLSPKQRRFVQEYVQSWNGTQAAIAAGYSERSAASIAHENLRKPEIRDEIEVMVAAHTMSATEALVLLTRQARADLSPYLYQDEETGRLWLNVGGMVANGLGHMIKAINLRQTLHGQQVRVELHDAQAALKLIGTYHGLFIERQELSTAPGDALEIKVVDYRNAIAALAPGSVGDSEASGSD